LTLPFVKNCGADQTGTSGIIQSPNYPNPYGNGVACVWNINAPSQMVINVTITNFQTEYNDKLFVSVYRYTYYPYGCYITSDKTFSGTLTSRSFLIQQNSASFYFYSDASGSLPGFNINWIAYSTSKDGCASALNSSFVKNCGSDLSGSSGNILSPNYPGAYGNNVACGWNITSPAGTVITLNITSFYVENIADKFYILLPQNCSSAVGKYVTGNLSSQIITIPQNQVSLYFVSDGSISYSGFNISWSAPTTCTAFVNSNTCCPSQVLLFLPWCSLNYVFILSYAILIIGIKFRLIFARLWIICLSLSQITVS
jgi:CUB domain